MNHLTSSTLLVIVLWPTCGNSEQNWYSRVCVPFMLLKECWKRKQFWCFRYEAHGVVTASLSFPWFDSQSTRCLHVIHSCSLPGKYYWNHIAGVTVTAVLAKVVLSFCGCRNNLFTAVLSWLEVAWLVCCHRLLNSHYFLSPILSPCGWFALIWLLLL